MTPMRRRDFLASIAASAACLCAAPRSGIMEGLLPTDPDRVLVLLQMSGGNDGLSMVVPFGMDTYHKVRRASRIPTESVLKLDALVGLNPSLKALMPIWESGRLAVIQGAGYPSPNRSHFESMDIWHAADTRGRDAGEGWVGRWADAVPDETFDANTVVHVGGDKPWSLHARRHAAVAFTRADLFKWHGTADEQAAFERVAETTGRDGGRDDAIERIRRAIRDAQTSSSAIRNAAAAYKPKAKYGNSALSRQLATIAALVHGGVRGRVYSVTFGGFDTHTGQRARHDALMADLGDSLAAFLSDLREQGHDKRVVVMTFSEFGRRIEENASGGTDHGTAGPMFVVGTPVVGGLYGTHPSLDDTDRGDLKFNVDFRRVYATLIDRWIGGDARRILDGEFAPLPFLA
jgi:uncharacterized protein (DUF1501 family)